MKTHEEIAFNIQTLLSVLGHLTLGSDTGLRNKVINHLEDQLDLLLGAVDKPTSKLLFVGNPVVREED